MDALISTLNIERIDCHVSYTVSHIDRPGWPDVAQVACEAGPHAVWSFEQRTNGALLDQEASRLWVI